MCLRENCLLECEADWADPCQEECGELLQSCSKPCSAPCHACQNRTRDEVEWASDSSTNELNNPVLRIRHAPHQCEKIFEVCGHPCGRTCSMEHDCGVCMRRCTTMCGHGSCSRGCGEVCEPCESCELSLSGLRRYPAHGRRAVVYLDVRAPALHHALFDGQSLTAARISRPTDR